MAQLGRRFLSSDIELQISKVAQICTEVGVFAERGKERKQERIYMCVCVCVCVVNFSANI